MSDNTGTEGWGTKAMRALREIWNHGSKPAAPPESGGTMPDGALMVGKDRDGEISYWNPEDQSVHKTGENAAKDGVRSTPKPGGPP